METSHWQSDYTTAASNAYFITLCTHHHLPLLGDHVNGSVELNACGEIVSTLWTQLRGAFPTVEIDTHVVMPNHFHGIIWVGTTPGTRPAIVEDDPAVFSDSEMRFGQQPTHPLAHVRDIVHEFKISTAAWINRYNGTEDEPIWQQRYWTKIVSTHPEVTAARNLISQNPQVWMQDKFFRPNIPRNLNMPLQ